MKTKTEKLAEEIKKISDEHKQEILALPVIGPCGGTNAKFIEGWKPTYNSTITRACKAAGLLLLDYWTGKYPTPQHAIPQCIWPEVRKQYEEIFLKEEAPKC